MGEYLKPILNQTVFTPSYITWPCLWCPQKFKDAGCVSNGKYCTAMYGSDTGLKGKELVVETLREYCLAKILEQDGTEHKFFGYIKEVFDLCGNQITERCHQLALKGLKIDKERV